MEDCFSDSVARGHHVFKSVWTPSLIRRSLTLGEVLSVKEEEENEHDIFAVSFEKAGMIVGHVEVSTRHGGSIICEVTGHRRLGKTAWIDHAGGASISVHAHLIKSAYEPQNTTA